MPRTVVLPFCWMFPRPLLVYNAKMGNFVLFAIGAVIRQLDYIKKKIRRHIEVYHQPKIRTIHSCQLEKVKDCYTFLNSSWNISLVSINLRFFASNFSSICCNSASSFFYKKKINICIQDIIISKFFCTKPFNTFTKIIIRIVASPDALSKIALDGVEPAFSVL